MNWKPMKIAKWGHKKVWLFNEKNEIKVDEGSLPLYGLAKKATKKLMNQFGYFE